MRVRTGAPTTAPGADQDNGYGVRLGKESHPRFRRVAVVVRQLGRRAHRLARLSHGRLDSMRPCVLAELQRARHWWLASLVQDAGRNGRARPKARWRAAPECPALPETPWSLQAGVKVAVCVGVHVGIARICVRRGIRVRGNVRVRRIRVGIQIHLARVNNQAAGNHF